MIARIYRPKIGILMGSLVAGTAGYVILRLAKREARRPFEQPIR